MLIGIAGKAGAGKDTVADYLCGRHQFIKYSLSTPIKAALCAMFGWHPAVFESRKFKEAPQEILGGKSPRQLMQTLGTEWGRNLVDQDLWLGLAERHVKESGCSTVIPDIRFENEADMIRANGGQIWHVTRDVEEVALHSSEGGIEYKPGAVVLINAHTVKDLEDEIRILMLDTV